MIDSEFVDVLRSEGFHDADAEDNEESVEDRVITASLKMIRKSKKKSAGLAEQLNLKSYRVIEYQHPPTIADILMGSAQSRSELSLLRELLQSPSPRAFYMLGNLGNESAFLKQ